MTVRLLGWTVIDKPGRINWVQAAMKKVGQLPEEWELTQRLFGELLLPMYPDKPVALIEKARKPPSFAPA